MNFKRVYRLWQREGLKVPKRTVKRRRLGHSANSCVRRRAEQKDHVWTWDFIHDRTASGRPLKWFAITDEYTRECLALEVDRSLPAERVLDVLTHLFLTRGVPEHIRSDNGPEFIATAIRGHAQQRGPGDVVHRAWCAVAERLCRIVLQSAARRVVERGRVHEPGRGSLVRPATAARAQPGATAQQSWLPDPGGVRTAVCCFRSGFGCASALTPAAHCRFVYPTHTLIIPGTEIRGIPAGHGCVPELGARPTLRRPWHR